MAGRGQGIGVPLRFLKYYVPQEMAESDFSRGIVRDMPRSSIPVGGLYDSTDFLFDQPGIARKRGGTSYQGSTTGATTTGVNFVAAPEYASGTKIVALGADGHLYDVTSTNVDAGAFGITTVDTPKLYPSGQLLVAASDGTSGPKKITVSAGTIGFANLGGSPPAGKYVAIHAGRPVLGGASATPNRMYFGPAPNIEGTWDVVSYIDCDHSLTGMASIQGVLLAFSAGATERITGSVPPDISGANMSKQPIGAVGCCDARSIAPWGTFVVFASQDGVWVTDGAGFDSLMEKSDGSGILSYWRDLYANVQANGGTISGGVFSKNYYFLSLTGTGVTQVTLMCYLPHKSWWRVTNIGATMFASSVTGSDELYAATSSGLPGNRVLKLSGIFTPSSSSKNDANGTAVTPMLETRMLGQGIGLKGYEHAHLTYDMRDASADNPTLAVQVSTGLEATTAYAAVPESPFAETTDSARKRFKVNKRAQAIQVKLTQSNASSKTEIYALEFEQRSSTFGSTSEF